VAELARQCGLAAPANASLHMRQIFAAETEAAYRAYLGHGVWLPQR
jgi:hypothetical protein